jgi:hypothetical protein
VSTGRDGTILLLLLLLPGYARADAGTAQKVMPPLLLLLFLH